MNRRKEKRQDAKKRGWKSTQSQHFLTVLDPFFELVLQEEFHSTDSLGSCIALAPVQMVSADLHKDAAWIPVNFVSSCTVGQLLGKEIMHTTCGIHLGCLWHSTGSLAVQPNVGSCHGP